jgi:hypothetical protein
MASLKPAARQIDPELRAITKWLQRKGSDHFLVTSHVNPDGDGLASMLACGRILRSLGKQVWLVADGFLSPRYNYLPQIDTVVSYREGLEAELPVANVITVDVPTKSRLERVERLKPAQRRNSSTVSASASESPSMRPWGPGSTQGLRLIPGAFVFPPRRQTP